MTEPDVRKGMPAVKLAREEFEKRYRSRFADPVFGPLQKELDAIIAAAWDAYLASYPAGVFAPEAAYNRALCLARLGKTAKATAALRPFARGRFGAYRRDEAALLLDWLASRAAATATTTAR